jgi:hypothetical protein
LGAAGFLLPPKNEEKASVAGSGAGAGAGAGAFGAALGALKSDPKLMVGLGFDSFGAGAFATGADFLGAAFGAGAGALNIDVRLRVGLGADVLGAGVGATLATGVAFLGAAFGAAFGAGAAALAFGAGTPKILARLRVGLGSFLAGAAFATVLGATFTGFSALTISFGGAIFGGVGLGAIFCCFSSHARALPRIISPASSVIFRCFAAAAA